MPEIRYRIDHRFFVAGDISREVGAGGAIGSRKIKVANSHRSMLVFHVGNEQ